jgi:hypothetical protein
MANDQCATKRSRVPGGSAIEESPKQSRGREATEGSLCGEAQADGVSADACWS